MTRILDVPLVRMDGPIDGPINTQVTTQLRSYSKWAPCEQGVTMVWRDLSIYALTGGNSSTQHRGLKRIINNVTGVVRSGTLMALMGASGAGKSTLMSALACREAPGTIIHGDILVNGRKVGPFMHTMSGFVHQEDLFVGTLTVLEHLTFMVNLKVDRRMSQRDKEHLIDELIQRSGLTMCTNTRIGHAGDGKVLSGGEKKRLAFATELITKPNILFCDEPTTGLDSFSARYIVRTLQDLARQGTAIICTIHQPSSELFSMFHEVMLLTEGRVAFMGPPRDALAFFAEHGHQCPDNYNPADFMIGLLATYPGDENTSRRTAHRICDLFAVSPMAEQRDIVVNLEYHMAEKAEFDIEGHHGRRMRNLRWYKKIYWLVYRAFLSVTRDSSIQTLRIVQKIGIAITAGLCFIGAVDKTQKGIQAMQGAIFICVSENTFVPMYSVLSTFPQDFPLLLREKKSGLYSIGQYYIAHLLAMTPGLVFEPLIFMCIGYWLMGLRQTFYAFGMTVLAAIMSMHASTACGYFFSAVFNNVPLALACLVPFDNVLMMTSGIFIQLDTLPEYLAWTKYLSWLMYSSETMAIVQWENIYNISCPVEPNLPCLENGDAVLDQYSFSANNLTRDLCALCGFYVVFHFLAYLFLWRRTKK
uniref:ABC transporter domain-containing protein n=2 Tax=Lutzomyia longipalpis TaxID=7200 RepID=A0A1B0ESG4_LUTLO